MEAYLWDWANLLMRWLHVIVGIAWIGASFYFVMLDNSIRPSKKESDKKRGVHGELWAVHGGGFYHSQKFLTGPKDEPLSENLHWSYWEAYSTWLSGMGLMLIVYWVGAKAYLIDVSVMDLTPTQAISISIAFIALSWIIYDQLCRRLEGRDNLLAAAVFVLILACDYVLFQIFSARAAYLHVGAIMGTMMVANVAMRIIPGQRRMVKQIRMGVPVDGRPGLIGKQRSVHNTYFTLPVLFIMISTHYPMTFSHEKGWLVLAVIMMAGVFIRQFFVLKHQGKKVWLYPVLGVALLGSLIVALSPNMYKSPMADQPVAAVSDADALAIVQTRCAMCHAEVPNYPGFYQAPKGIILETQAQLEQHATLIASTVASKYMPLANLSKITDEERAQIAKWFADR
ncbi:urate hydroxylase PuuD [Leucothrix mucor]|uniref:urate hydroxylase PuuD n=1 Tax=Leucothrix mucor TaxID=45248 RepID=UPI0003B44769|nr:urate hydroxylase PuuD [Leucothrix mucor]